MIRVTGLAVVSDGFRMVVRRLLEDGTLDATFGDGSFRVYEGTVKFGDPKDP